MIYRVIGLMSGSSLDGVDLAFVHLHYNAGKWEFDWQECACIGYPEQWVKRLSSATTLSALDYQLLHTEYGHYLGKLINNFIEEHALQYKVQLISSHGHTTFHIPGKKMTAQLGDGAAIAAETGINVVSDLRAMDVALGGQGAPIVPIGEKMFWQDIKFFLNLGGIANLSIRNENLFQAADICPANRVLNLLANKLNKPYDAEGMLAASGKVDEQLLEKLNALDYYAKPWPKSLANEFGTAEVFPLIESYNLKPEDALCTYCEHISIQVSNAIKQTSDGNSGLPAQMLVTGGGALNSWLVKRLNPHLQNNSIQVIIPDNRTVLYKEALIMALAGTLRWREETTVLASVTGALRDSIGGAVWIGQQA
jgi:anhydro-N-acetylmuramic acid kinase